MAAKPERAFKIAADNRRARYNYEIGETFEAGLMLAGTEVKALRSGKATIAESYASVERSGEVLPLKIYFNDKGRAKIEIALAKGKKLHDKRETERQRDWNREKSRLLKQNA